jgi:hypothetical protein
MVVSSAGLGAESDCSGKAQNQLGIHPLVREGVSHQETRNFETVNKNP